MKLRSRETKVAAPAVADLAAYRRRKGCPRTKAALGAVSAPLAAAVCDNELHGDAKLLVVCWTALQEAAGPEAASMLDAVTLATGLRGYAALRWTASVIIGARKAGHEAALASYISVDWPRLQRWAVSFSADYDQGRAGATGRAENDAAVSVHGYP
ncbi:hypothetical protein A5658_04785 [Mycobacterium sp. 1245111.1]|uniref:hypothetical protein n=1 Tax=Mycobacterium sp. 1245111.1 TaxID=1834073 RepID=UPI000801E6AB|nr:hypothetical protein [Mycobacterium sp. 1245111.1]OBK36978.1 hypothetical protein A5658_04785 [Mycobacterium sp. 1245111.1]